MFYNLLKLTAVIIGLTMMVACATNSNSAGDKLQGNVRIDGSSTVFPITEAVAEEFGKLHPRVRVTVGVSGTGGGFKKFFKNEIHINDASRTIKDKEIKTAHTNGIDFMEIPVAYDGISIVVHPDNKFVNHLSVAELKAIWHPDSKVKNWSDVRKEWPTKRIKLFGPGVDSGTFDYFTKAINGEEQLCRSDFTASEDDNVLVQGVSGEKYSLGFFGFAYYTENRNKLKLVPVDGGNGPVNPTLQTINSGSYKPLSRPIFIYLNLAALREPAVREFTKFYLENAGQLAEEVGYVALPNALYSKRLAELAKFSPVQVALKREAQPNRTN